MISLFYFWHLGRFFFRSLPPGSSQNCPSWEVPAVDNHTLFFPSRAKGFTSRNQALFPTKWAVGCVPQISQEELKKTNVKTAMWWSISACRIPLPFLQLDYPGVSPWNQASLSVLPSFSSCSVWDVTSFLEILPDFQQPWAGIPTLCCCTIS